MGPGCREVGHIFVRSRAAKPLKPNSRDKFWASEIISPQKYSNILAHPYMKLENYDLKNSSVKTQGNILLI